MSLIQAGKGKRENFGFISDFLLRVSKIAGNAKLSYDKCNYYINVEKENGEYINYSIEDAAIQQLLEGGGKNIIYRSSSTKSINSRKDEMALRRHEEEYNLYSNDNYPWEALTALPFDLKRTIGSEEIGTPDSEKREQAEQLVSGLINFGSKNKSTDEEEKEQKTNQLLMKLLSNIWEVSPNMSIHVMDGKYFVSVPTRDGQYMIYSTTDSKLKSGDNNIFQWIEATRDIRTKALLENPHKEISDINGKLIQHDATVYEIAHNLPDELGLEYDAADIDAYLQRVARSGSKEAADIAMRGDTSKDIKYIGE